MLSINDSHHLSPLSELETSSKLYTNYVDNMSNVGRIKLQQSKQRPYLKLFLECGVVVPSRPPPICRHQYRRIPPPELGFYFRLQI